MEFIQQPLHHLAGKIISARIKRPRFLLKQYFILLLSRVKSIGISETMDEYDKGKLGFLTSLTFSNYLQEYLFPLLVFLIINNCLQVHG
jgi:hypothetical protein